MKKFKHYVAIFLTALVTVFIIQNMAQVELVFLDAEFEAPRSIVLIIIFLVGAFVGSLTVRDKSYWGR
jgi:uncharacterized integral membrane protein